MNYSQPEVSSLARRIDRRTNQHMTPRCGISSTLWEVGLILLVALVLVFFAWIFGAQGLEVAAIAHANRGISGS